MPEIKEPIFGHGFADIIDSFSRDETVNLVESATLGDVDRVIAKARKTGGHLKPEEFAILLSPAADARLEQMAALSHLLTSERFGKPISLYIPMYVGNACTNKCVYCGFNHDNKFTRKILTEDEVERECEAIKSLGPFDNLLIVAGEYPSLCGPDYLERVLKICGKHFNNLN
ncbi:MAG: 2-iminoacetate synthase ThiH, partial [Muribaculaceae bacterium]|nr:2-iminoacetate synthase ThiH [Muribaculaceae bacterium]